MNEQDFGTIAALEFRASPDQGFEDIVEEFDIAFRPMGLSSRSLTWNDEDIAFIERDSIRIALGWLPSDTKDVPGFLIVAVGQAPNSGGIHVDPLTCAMLKSHVLQHAETYLPIGNVLHADATQPVGTELIDMVSEMLRRDYQKLGDTAPAQDSGAFGWSEPVKADPAYEVHPKSCDTAQGEMGQNDAANVLDAEFYDLVADKALSLPKRLTIYTLGATMLLYTPPVGITLLVYTTLRDFGPDEPPRLLH